MSEFREVPFSDGLLRVNEDGVVYSKEFIHFDKKGVTQTFKGRIRKQYVGNHGYYCFRFRSKFYLTHRCVALCFVDGNDGEHNVVNHMDGDKLNNHFSNLEWCSYSENNQHAWDNGLQNNSCRERGESRHNSKLLNNEVIQIVDMLKSGTMTQREIASKFNISNTVVCNIKLGKSWRHITGISHE